jgi:ABC-type nitrate/sulfonate/bicarbonate transport system substrate-binding protein
MRNCGRGRIRVEAGRRAWRRRAIIAAPLLLLLQQSAVGAAETVVSMAMLGPPSNVSYLLPIIAQQGFDKKNGIDFKPALFPDPANAYADFAAKRQDLAVGGFFNAANFYGKGLKCQLLFTLTTTNQALLAKHEGLKSAEDLKGKTIGATTSSGFYGLALLYFRANGLDPRKNLSVISGAPSAVQAQLFAGKIDAGLLIEPLVSNALQQGYHTVGDMAGDIRRELRMAPDAPVWYLGVFGWSEWIENHPDLALALLRTWQDAADFYERNPDDAEKLISDFAKVPAAALRLSREKGFNTIKVVPAIGEQRNIDAILGGLKSVGFIDAVPDDGLYYRWPALSK